jgi:DNA repair exonuclease SbcCD nuclease subunit
MVKKLIHIADLHIRTFQLHDLYKTQFNRLITELKNEVSGLNYDEVRVVIAGDVAHQKINISNEQMMLTSWFLNQLVENIGKLVIIPGNHDFLENNTQRLDSITPIVELLGNENISYYKDSGVYKDDNINWVVYSLYQHNQRPEFGKSIDGEINVGLFHGVVQGMSTDMGFQFEDGYDRLNFVDLDVLLCGDIHKRQQFKLPNGGKGIMVGSLIQQNFGETVKHHGYGVYDVLNDDYKFIDLENEQPFLHFLIKDIKDIENEKEELLNIG